MSPDEAKRLKLQINNLRYKAEAVFEDLATGKVVPPSRYAEIDNYSRNTCALVDSVLERDCKEES